MTEQNQNIQTWIEAEEAELKQMPSDFEKLESLKFEENVITEVMIDCVKPFERYDTTNMKGEPIIKAIIPVFHNNVRKNWWLNKRNPIYREVLNLCKGKTTVQVKIIRTGKAQATKYAIVK